MLIGAVCVSVPGVADDIDICSTAGGHEAVAACDRAIASGKLASQRLASAHYNRGLILLQFGEHDRAIRDFDISVRFDAASPLAFNNPGSAWYTKGDRDRALADFSEAIRLDQKYALAYNNRGKVWKDKRDFPRAIADYSEAIRFDPSLFGRLHQ